jgi:nucleoside-diphosphate-sugar epimerase
VKVLVVGGTGFVSGAISRALHARGHDVVAYHRGKTAAAPGIADVRSPDATIPVMRFPSLAPDVVLHAVAVGGADARAAVRAFPRARIVALSSGDVYKVYGALLGFEDAPAAGPLAEDAPLRTVEYPYGRSAQTPWGVLSDYEKLHVERAVLEAGGTVLRLGKVYGRGDRWLDAMTDRVRVERPRWRWTHVFVDDVAQAAALVVERPVHGGVFNVGESATPTQLERLTALARLRALPLAVGADEHAPDLVLDSTRIRRELGFVETPPDVALRTLSRGA